jgi:hypothetical protein
MSYLRKVVEMKINISMLLSLGAIFYGNHPTHISKISVQKKIRKETDKMMEE